MPSKNASGQAYKEDCKPEKTQTQGQRVAARSVSRGWVWRRAAAALPAGARVCVAALLASAIGSSAGADEDAECTRGETLRRSGSTRAALAAYKACVARGGGDAVTRHNLGVALIDKKQWLSAWRFQPSRPWLSAWQCQLSSEHVLQFQLS